MAFFSPLGAIGAAAGGYMDERRQQTTDKEHQDELDAIAALSTAFFPGGLGGMGALGGMGQQGPQAPPPGMASQPPQPPPQPSQVQAGPYPGPPTTDAGPAGGASNPQLADAMQRIRQGQGQPIGYGPADQAQQIMLARQGSGGNIGPAAMQNIQNAAGGAQMPPGWPSSQQPQQQPQPPPGPPQQQMPPQARAPMPQQGPQQQVSPQGLPQLDLQTLAERIKQRNPNISPRVMGMALLKAMPLLNAQGRIDLARSQQEATRSYRGSELEIQRERLGLERQRNEALYGTGPAGDAAGDRAIAKGIAEYRIAPPTGNAMRNPRNQKMMSMVFDINPDYRASEFAGEQAGARTLATQESRTGFAAEELANTIPLARQAMAQVPRTDFKPFNELIQGYQNQTLSPQQAKLHTALQGVSNAYASVMNRGASINNVTAQNRAHDMLSGANNQASLNAVLEQMEQEIAAVRAAPEKVRAMFRNRYGNKAFDPPQQGQGAGAQQGGGGGQEQLPPAAVKSLQEGQITTFGNGQGWTLENGQPKRVR